MFVLHHWIGKTAVISYLYLLHACFAFFFFLNWINALHFFLISFLLKRVVVTMKNGESAHDGKDSMKSYKYH